MASSSSSTMTTTTTTAAIGAEEERRNWLELPREMTAAILSRLVAIDILIGAQFVCKSWLEISNDPLVWRRIDMDKVGDLDLDMDLVKMCRHAVDRSSGHLADINIEYFGNDDLLDYIADRSKLKRLRLACCYKLTEERMTDVIAKFPLLEELDLTLCPFSTAFLQAVGRSCPRLESFKLNCQAYRISIDPEEEDVYNAEAFAIGKNMPALRRLQLIGNIMTNVGLKAILDGCPRLESLDLRRCLNLIANGSLWKRCTEQVKDLRCPCDPTDDYEFVTGLDDGSDLDGCHHCFSDPEEYLEFSGDELEYSDHSDVSSGDESFDYDYYDM